MRNVVVLGSFVMDLVGIMERFPVAGESVVGKRFTSSLGGKGANQAVAISRLGGTVTMLGMLGKDLYGEKFRECFEKEGIDTSHILASDSSTGVGLVQINEEGQNRICIILGANLDYSEKDFKKAESLLTEGDIFLTQFEMDKEMTDKAILLAKKKGMTTFLNPAPYREVSDKVLSSIDYISPNETEAASIAKMEKIDNLDDAEAAARHLLGKGVKNVIITLGDKGAFFMNEKEKIYMPSRKIKAIDTVGAGDSFTGAFVIGLAEGKSHKECMRMAASYGTYTCLGQGGIPSLRTRTELEEFLKTA